MPLVHYKLLQPLGENKEGDTIAVEQEIGDKLVEAGLAEEATAEDMNPAEEEAAEGEEAPPMVANSINRLAKEAVEKAENTAAARLAKELRKQKPEPDGILVPAAVKEKAYRSNGAYIRGIIKAMNNCGVGRSVPENERIREWNRINEFQGECVKSYDQMGIVTKAPPLGIQETSNAAGGFLVNPQFSPDVYAIDHGQLDLAGMCENIEAQTLIFNQRYINETSLANGSIFGGLNMVATSEGASFSSSLPAWANVAYTLAKESLFVYYTSEILEDASYPVESELNEYVDKAFLYGINTQIIQGATYEGILNSPGLVTITSSANDTAFHTTPSTCLTYADVAAMFTAVYPECQQSPKGVWLFHPSLQQSVLQMTYSFSTGGVPAWGLQFDAQQGLDGQGKGPLTPYKLYGKPAYPHWACSAPGAAGDIIYIDFRTVLAYRRPFRVEVSKDFQFGTDQVAVRYVYRAEIKTRWRNQISGPTGTAKFSSMVTRTAAGT